MQLLSINDIFAAPVFRALCYTLVHSLWIGLVLSLLTGIIMLSTKKSSAALRYNLLTGAFISYIVAMIAVFIIQIADTITPVQEQITAAAGNITVAESTAVHFYLIPAKESISSGITNFIDRYASFIVLFWLVMIVFRSIRFAGGIKKINQLKHTQLSSAGDAWNEKLISLSQQLGIRRTISFFQSGIATIPMVAGHFKPVILFPIGLLTALPPEEVEAILIHELAHIKRKDFLVNMLQHVAEILFFFNPAVLWVSSLIKIERENCCDDIAVANTGNKRNYINALVSFQEYHLNNLQYAPALAGTKKHLLQRVKRMLYDNPGSLNNREKTSLTVCLVAVATLMIFFTNAGVLSKNKAAGFSPVSDSVVSIADRHYDPAAFKEGHTMVLSEKIKGIVNVLRILKRNGVLYEIYGDVKSFKINGMKIPQSEWAKYKTLIAALIKETRNTKVITAQEVDAADAQKRDADNRIAEQDNRITAQQKRIAEQDKRIAEQDSRMAEEDSRVSEEDSRVSAADSKVTESENKYQEDRKKKNMQPVPHSTTTNVITDIDVSASINSVIKEKNTAQKNKVPLSKVKNEQISKSELEWRKTENGEQVVVSKLSYAVNNNVNTAPRTNYNNNYNAVPYPPYPGKTIMISGIQYDSDSYPAPKETDIRSLTQNIINDLTSAKIITDAKGLSYKISAETLIVNGVVQPEAVHKKLKEKYIQNKDWKLLYNWKETQ